MMCSMDEMAKALVLQFSNSKSRIRKISRQTNYLVKCIHDECNIVAHTCIPQEGKFHTLPNFAGLTCFEISHHPRCIDALICLQGLITKGNGIIEPYHPIL